jgi:branched-chain amino acid transport system substrate-binding protein
MTPEAMTGTGSSDTAMDMANSVMVNPGSEVVIGLAAAFSGEGLAPLGIDIRRGAELALEDRPTVTVGGVEFTVRLDAQDDLCSADGGQAVANRFVSDPQIMGVVGPMCSSACSAAAPIFDSAGYSSISPSCTAANLTTSGYSSFNRAVATDAAQGVIAAEYIFNTLGARRIATIHDGSPYAEGLVAIMSARFVELGGEIVAADAISVGDSDFRGLLEDIAAANPDLIYFGGFPAEASRLAIQRGDTGLENVTFVGADGINTQEFIDLAGSASEGVYASKSIPSSSDALAAFLARYVETYGEEPPAPFHANAYDAVNILLDGIEAVGVIDANGDLVVDRAALAAYLRQVSDFQGLTGVLSADGSGEMSSADFGFFQVQEGALVEVAIGRIAEGEVIIEPVE